MDFDVVRWEVVSFIKESRSDSMGEECFGIRYLLWGYAERDGSHVYHFMTLHAGETEVKT